MYIYSTHKTMAAAIAAMEHYFAAGDMSDCEFAGIKRRPTSRGVRYDVMLYH